jgi:hypothetical protein
MKELPISASDEDVKNVIRQWVGLLAGEQYDKALELISPAVLPGSGSLNHKAAPRWTAHLLEAVIIHYGVSEPLDDPTHKFKVAPVDASLQEMFEARLEVDRQHFNEFGQSYVGTIHVDLPLIYEDRVSLSDLTARFYLSPIGGAEMVLVLLDIHVL